MKHLFTIVLALLFILSSCSEGISTGSRMDFNSGWKFYPGDDSSAFQAIYNDNHWKNLNLPHDWSIEGNFSIDNPAGPEGGALPTGIAWYRKSFVLNEPVSDRYHIDFDGVMSNSEVWINGHYLGKRPYGYSSFRYELTPYLHRNDSVNVIAVKVDNSDQPASRWYTGSGIYRNVWLVPENDIHIAHWGTFVSTPTVTANHAKVRYQIDLINLTGSKHKVKIKSVIYNADGLKVTEQKSGSSIEEEKQIFQEFNIDDPDLWSPENPVLYRVITEIYKGNQLYDRVETPFGIRTFKFTPLEGFFLNGKVLKIQGVNQHHDLGALGAAFNERAAERQLEILKAMGCNAIRMAHNPPAPELLDLCDQMGFLVIDEAFDEWKRTKVKRGYHLYWDEWHKRDLQDMVLRDRNHPSIIAWSIGNEIPEQFDSTGITIARELVGIVKELDTTRYVTSALTETDPEKNNIYKSGALDLLSFNYKHKEYLKFPDRYPGECMLPSENNSALATRGHYELPSDSVRIWPPAYNKPFDGNADFTASSYDNAIAYWGSTHEATWAVVKNNTFIPGMFVWSGFDYLGEPIPYPYPARSSYLGIIDLCGFPKDTYYMYQSEWSDETMLHLFPHWNWKAGQLVDIWAYYNNADEVELFLNGASQGVKHKSDDQFHVMWRIPFESGTIKAVSRKNGEVVLEKEISTAGEPYKIELSADRSKMYADGKDLSFVTVRVLDRDGNLVPHADNLINFEVAGTGFIAGVDNGYQASLEPFRADHRKAYNGMCLLIVQAKKTAGEISFTATSDQLKADSLVITTE
ncbi:beta-galactosidase GalB [Saccharicrinis sp. FJH2]|uniref:beta-galactosidase GalB n=1 Tax=Saccharicrinis sp. FJH65 TaxID=3344659 RepID=UPI0035F357B9